MAKDNKKTVYQNLNTFLNLDGAGLAPEDLSRNPDEKILLKAEKPEELKVKALEIQQKEVVFDKFFKIQQSGFQKAMQYEAARLPAYIDYEGMEYYPLIASALDLLMEEATTIGDDGKMLRIYSKKERIKEILEEFFYGTLNINVNLPFWTRNLPIKHDSIIPLLDGTEITIKELSERLKNNPNEEIWTYSVLDNTNDIVPGKIVWCNLTRKDEKIYRTNLDDNTYIETTADHEFILRNGIKKRADKLKSGDSLMPFYTKKSIKEGTSWLVGYEKTYNPATNYYKFTHRIVSQNLLKNNDETKVEPIHTHHINFNKLNNDPKNLIRLKQSEHLKLHQEIAIKNLHTPEIKEKRLKGIDKYLRSDSRRNRMSKEMSGIYPKYNSSDFHKEHNSIRSNSMKNHWNDNNYKSSTQELMKIHISDECFDLLKNEIINFNNFISKNEFCNQLKSNEIFINLFKESNRHIKRNSIKSLNSTTLERLIKRKINLNYYELIESLNPKITNDKKFLSAKNISEAKKKKEKVLNHKVVSVELIDGLHDAYCMEVVGKNGEHDRHNFPVCSKNIDGNHTRNGVFVVNCKYGDNFVYLLGEKDKGIRYARQLVNFDIERKDDFKDKKMRTIFKNRITGDEFNLFEIAHFRLLGDDKFLPYGSSVLNKVRRVFRQLIMAEDAMLTYRILRAGEKRVFKVDVGNMDDKDIEAYVMRVANKFKKQQQVYKNNGQIDYRFNILGNDEDIFMPVRDGKSTVIETLPGATNLDAIQDITYLRDNLFSGLGIPKPFLGFQGSAGEGKNLAQMDVRFAKKVNRIQQALIQELNKMAIIHLYLKGFEDDLHEFSLTLTNPSTQADKLKTESLQAKVQLYNDLTRTESSGIAAASHTWAKRNVFNWSDKEIMEDLKNQRMERAISQELQDTGTVIPKTGVFDTIDKKYGTSNPLPAQIGGTPPEQGEGENSGNPPPEAGATNAPQTPAALPPPQGAPAPNAGVQTEGSISTKKSLNEDSFDEKLDKLLGNKNHKDQKDKEEEDDDSLSSRAKSLNLGAKKMITEIDKMMHRNNNSLNNEASDKNFTFNENKNEDKKKEKKDKKE